MQTRKLTTAQALVAYLEQQHVEREVDAEPALEPGRARAPA